MQEMNENPFHSWQPRRPSRGLKRRIFGSAVTQEDLPSRQWLWGLAPTMACALLTLMALNHNGGGFESRMPMNLILSNQDSAVFASGGGQVGQNHLANVTFGWTNRSDFQSSIRFTPPTNLTN